jgi:hypothetical protein
VTVELVVDLGDDGPDGSIVCGAHSKPFLIDPTGRG